MKRIIIILIIVSLFTGSLFAAGGRQGSGSGTVEIQFWDSNPGPERTPHFEEIIKWYHEAQTRVKVQYVGVPQSEAMNKINVAVAGNSAPDVAGFQTGWLSGLIAQKALVKLDSLFESWNENKQFDPGAISPIRMADANNGLYGVPYTLNTGVIWYRIDRFRDAGLQVPKTWDELFIAIEKLTDKSKGQYGWVMRGGDAGGPSTILSFLFAYSGNDSYFDANGRCALRDPEVLEMLTRFVKIYNVYTAEGDINYNYQMMVAAFDSGSGNMMQHNLGSLGEHKRALPDGTYGAFMFPNSVKGQLNISRPDSLAYAIFDQSKQKDASWDFIKTLCSEKAISFWNERVGQYPVRFDTQGHDWVKNADHLKNLVTALQSPATTYYDLPTYLPEYNRIITEVAQPGWQAVMLGRMRPADYLDEWATAMEQAYKRYQDATRR